MLCWNRLPLSRRCLSSYRATISASHELFVIDNASTDGTAEWLAEVARLPDVSGVISMPRNDPAAALNEGLSRCAGRYLHIMENDYEYRPGWDHYVLDRFERIPTLGQIALFEGGPHFRAGSHEGLVWIARENVVTASVLRRRLFFEQRVRVHGHYLGKRYPNDHDLSRQVREAGWLVAWPDRELARHVGIEAEEQARDPGYYVRDYALKLFSLGRLRGNVRRWSRGDFDDTATLIRRLTAASRAKLRRAFLRGGRRDDQTSDRPLR